MRVRHMQSYLTECKLIKRSRNECLRNMTIGIDALYFLRTMVELKDTLSDAAGCISPSICFMLDKVCDKFKNLNMRILFVFEGITPKAHKLFFGQHHQYLDQGWYHLVDGVKSEAYKSFSQVSNMCNSDLTYLLFHYLKSKGYKCIYAPYLAISQLAYFYKERIVDIIYGPASVILMNVPQVVIDFNWNLGIFEWVDLPFLLKTWNLNKQQLIDTCLLAGTEYCLTFPYLNLQHISHPSHMNMPQFGAGPGQFHFGSAIEFIKQMPLVSFLQHFPSDEMRNCHLEGYCICKTMLKYPAVMLSSGQVDFFLNDYLEGPEMSPSFTEQKDSKGNDGLNEKNKKIQENPAWEFGDEKEGEEDTDEMGKNDNGKMRREGSDESEECSGNLRNRLGKEINVKKGSSNESSTTEEGLDVDNNRTEIIITGHDKTVLSGSTNSAYHFAPCDYIKVVGAKFPASIYYLMSIGIISKKLLCVLALGEWVDYSHPIIDSFEYRDSLIDLREYRCKTLGIICTKLNPFFHKRKIKFCENKYHINNICEKNNKYTYLSVDLVDKFLWKINKDNVIKEMNRQNRNKIDFQFVLKWHIFSESKNISLIQKMNLSKKDINISAEGGTSKSEDGCNVKTIGSESLSSDEDTEEDLFNNKKLQVYNEYYKNVLKKNNQNFDSFVSLVYCMFLEHLGIFTKNCGVTLFGLLLSEVKSPNLHNNILIIFELLKFGFLTTEPLLPPNGRNYPRNAYAFLMNNTNLEEQDKKSVLLLSRIYSLYDANIDQCKKYKGLIDFDLCAFFSVVKIIKKTLRQLLHACVANVLISNMDLIHILPEHLYSPIESSLSCFFVTNHFMGVLTKFFLLFNFDDVKMNASLMETSPSNSVVRESLNNTNNKNHLSSNNNNNVSNSSSNSSNSGKSSLISDENTKEKGSKGNIQTPYESAVVVTDDKCDHDSQSLYHSFNDTQCSRLDETITNVDHQNAINKNIDQQNNSPLGSGMNEEEPYLVTIDDSTNLEKDIESADAAPNNVNENENKNSIGISDRFLEFEKVIKENFPTFLDPINDLCQAINTWREHLSLIVQLEKHTNVYDLVSDLKAADQFLEKKIHYVELHKTPVYRKICASYNT